jgi:hypothetical protein
MGRLRGEGLAVRLERHFAALSLKMTATDVMLVNTAGCQSAG